MPYAYVSLSHYFYNRFISSGLWFECEMSSIDSLMCCILGPNLWHHFENCGTFRGRALLERSEHWGQAWGFTALPTSCSLSASTTASCSHPCPSTMEWIPQTVSQKRSFLPYTAYCRVFCSMAETVTRVPCVSVCGSRIILVVEWHFANYVHGRYWIY